MDSLRGVSFSKWLLTKSPNVIFSLEFFLRLTFSFASFSLLTDLLELILLNSLLVFMIFFKTLESGVASLLFEEEIESNVGERFSRKEELLFKSFKSIISCLNSFNAAEVDGNSSVGVVGLLINSIGRVSLT